jgi:hypothetical protein
MTTAEASPRAGVVQISEKILKVNLFSDAAFEPLTQLDAAIPMSAKNQENTTSGTILPHTNPTTETAANAMNNNSSAETAPTHRCKFKGCTCDRFLASESDVYMCKGCGHKSIWHKPPAKPTVLMDNE